jgi:hypothetical protein
MPIERIVNLIASEPEEGRSYGYISTFRPIDAAHEERLIDCNKGFREVVITEASPLACPVEKDLSKSQFCEKFGTVPNWIE